MNISGRYAIGVTWRRWVLLLCAALVWVGCGEAQEQSIEPIVDPMEMQREYRTASQEYQLSPAVRFVAPLDENGQVPPLIIGSHVYQMPEDLLARATVDKNSIEVPLAGHDYVKNRKSGDIIISPGGGLLWHRIVRVEQLQDAVRWHTEPAEMTEIFQHAEFYLQIDTSKVDPKTIPHVDLTAPYLNPEAAPLLRTRGFEAGESCPVAPQCHPVTQPTCVLVDNPEVLCPEPEVIWSDDYHDRRAGEKNRSGYICATAYDYRTQVLNVQGKFPNPPCMPRTECVVADDPQTACPLEELHTCGEPDGYCKKATMKPFDGVNFASIPAKYRNYQSGALTENFDLEDYSCRSLASGNSDKYLIYQQGCTENSSCGGPDNGTVCQMNLGGDGCGLHASSDGEGGMTQADSCSSGADCCSGNCQGGVCVANDIGFCVQACADTDKDKKYEEEDHGSKFLQLLEKVANKVGLNLGNDSATKLEVRFKPEITLKIKIDWFKLERIEMGIGADYYTHVGLEFEFSENFEAEAGVDDHMMLFGFAIFGYPFSIDLMYKASAYVNASVEGKFAPQFYNYTYRDEDDLWMDHEGKGFPEGAPPELPVPALKGGASGKAGLRMGIVYQNSGDACDSYPESDGYSCERMKGKWVRYQRNLNQKYFDPGIEAELKVRAGAEAGLGVGLYDRGLGGVDGSLIVGVEPINLLAKAYAVFDAPLCGFGYSLYFRMFLHFGGLKIMGFQLIPEMAFLMFSKRLLGDDFVIPDSFYEPGPDGSCPPGVKPWVCTLVTALKCGVMPPEPEPSTTGMACMNHAQCPVDGDRCIGGKCTQAQPADSLRVTLNWTVRKNLNLVVKDPAGQEHTLAGSSGAFAETCGDPNATCGQNRLAFAESAHFDLSGLNPGDTFRFWVMGDPAQASQNPELYEIEVEQDGHPAQSFEAYLTAPVNGGGQIQTPMKFEYVVR